MHFLTSNLDRRSRRVGSPRMRSASICPGTFLLAQALLTVMKVSVNSCLNGSMYCRPDLNPCASVLDQPLNYEHDSSSWDTESTGVSTCSIATSVVALMTSKLC